VLATRKRFGGVIRFAKNAVTTTFIPLVIAVMKG
jgi:hypothetical protein